MSVRERPSSVPVGEPLAGGIVAARPSGWGYVLAVAGLQPGGGRAYVPLNGRAMSFALVVTVASLFAIAGVLLLALSFLADRGDPAVATVVGVGSGGVVDLAVEGAGTSTVAWSGDVAVGDRVDVLVLDGEPRQPSPFGRAFSLWFATVACIAAVVAVKRALPTRGMAGPQRRALQAAVRGAPARPVLVGGLRFAGEGVRTTLWVDVLDGPTLAPLGSVRAPKLGPTFHPGLLRVLVGDPAGPVALEDQTRRHRLLPSTPLVSPPPSAPWSQEIVSLLGWDRVGPLGGPGPGSTPPPAMETVAPPLVSPGRVSFAEERPMGAPRSLRLPAAMVALSKRSILRGRFILGAYAVVGVATIAATVAVEIAAGLAVLATGMIVVLGVGGMLMRRDVRAMDALLTEHLGPGDRPAQAVAVLVLTFAAGADPEGEVRSG